MLVVPNFDQVAKWAAAEGLTFPDHGAMIHHPKVQAKMEQEVLQRLHGLAHFEQPKKVALLEHDFTIESGELTPTLKVKRRVVDKRYKALIDALYESPGGGD
jgi:long-chain acyl-CoA synthetase